jgi:hypothetical protein
MGVTSGCAAIGAVLVQLLLKECSANSSAEQNCPDSAVYGVTQQSMEVSLSHAASRTHTVYLTGDLCRLPCCAHSSLCRWLTCTITDRLCHCCCATTGTGSCLSERHSGFTGRQ